MDILDFFKIHGFEPSVIFYKNIFKPFNQLCHWNTSHIHISDIIAAKIYCLQPINCYWLYFSYVHRETTTMRVSLIFFLNRTICAMSILQLNISHLIFITQLAIFYLHIFTFISLFLTRSHPINLFRFARHFENVHVKSRKRKM